MSKEVLESVDLHIEHPATDGKVIGIPDTLIGTRYVWRETKPVATTKVQAPRYSLLKPNSATNSED